MRKIFLVTLCLLLLANLYAQNGSTPKEIIYGRKDGVALTILQLIPAGKPEA